ncbi:hypothetical protein TERTU_1795 [Teredinibacter turnerae T7901]|uniref:Uncharacterized protein n=1 Tax=Teredinibacter turnerae (strain ATCC 39867 / T7901) TaxID=377629 RepID=C5BHR9_TERTT|nr:hypothetical protein TERTU_1795 [Teredinibacter turnerae T7901]
MPLAPLDSQSVVAFVHSLRSFSHKSTATSSAGYQGVIRR